jgi:hypothetical protein
MFATSPTRLPLVSRAFFKRTNPADADERRKLFVENNLMITESAEFDAEFARYPVLHIDLSVSQYLDCASSHADRDNNDGKNVTASNMDDLLVSFAGKVFDIARGMQRDGYFLRSQELDEGYQTFLRDVLKRRLSKDQLHSALYHLTSAIAQLMKRKTIVLIDEYDTPASYAAKHNYFPDVCP